MKTIYLVGFIAIVLWLLSRNQKKVATQVKKVDPNETILAAQSAYYPFDNPNLDDNPGFYAGNY